MVMGMYFNTFVRMKNILFEGWDTNSTKDALIASAIALVFTIVYEGAKMIKSYIIIRKEQSPLTYGMHSDDNTMAQQQQEQHSQSRSAAASSSGVSDIMEASSTNMSTTSTSRLLAPLKIPTSIQQIKSWRIRLFVMESFLNVLNIICGYIIMLLVMSYSVWFLVAVLVGSGVGFFVFDPMRQMYSDKYLSTDNPISSTARHETSSPSAAPSGSSSAVINVLESHVNTRLLELT